MIALGLVGAAAVFVLTGLVISFLGPVLQLLYGLWGLIGLILLVIAILGTFAAFLAYLLTGRRAEPQFEPPATIESLETKQP